jgi:hypothetical protein
MVGTFDVDNFGDLLFPIVAEHELTARLPGVELRRYSYHDSWHHQQGGELAILTGPDHAAIHVLVAPRLGSSALIERSDRSWHSVRPVVGNARRRSVTVTFYRPGSPSTMWPVGDLQPLAHLPA